MYFTPLRVCGVKGALKPNQEKARRVRAPRRGRCWGLGKRLCPRHLVHRRGCRTPGTRAHPSRLPVPLSPGPRRRWARQGQGRGKPLWRQGGFGAPSPAPPADPTTLSPLRACPEPRKSPQLPAASPRRLPLPTTALPVAGRTRGLSAAPAGRRLRAHQR